ncbi:hypothetical protein IWZ01DRAFT_570723 [Phyllosticta capitalensis]
MSAPATAQPTTMTGGSVYVTSVRVLWYDFEVVFGRYTCPVCDETHERDFPLLSGNSRGFPRSHTELWPIRPRRNMPYTKFVFEYPMAENMSTPAWEFDGMKKRWISREFAAELAQPRSGTADLLSAMQTLSMDEGRPDTSNGSEAEDLPSKEHAGWGFLDVRISEGDCRLLKNSLQHFRYGSGAIIHGYGGFMCVVSWAASEGYMNILQMLLQHGANPNRKSLDGETPLMCAVRRLRFNCAYMLLRNGADRSIRNDDGETAEDIAQKMMEATPGSSDRYKIFNLLRTE